MLNNAYKTIPAFVMWRVVWILSITKRRCVIINFIL